MTACRFDLHGDVDSVRDPTGIPSLQIGERLADFERAIVDAASQPRGEGLDGLGTVVSQCTQGPGCPDPDRRRLVFERRQEV